MLGYIFKSGKDKIIPVKRKKHLTTYNFVVDFLNKNV